jgi:hypothetical protein
MENGLQEMKKGNLIYWIGEKCERKFYNKRCKEI